MRSLAYNVPNCNDIASCTGCTDDVECFCEQTKTIVRFPCKLNDRGIRILEEYDLKSELTYIFKILTSSISLNINQNKKQKYIERNQKLISVHQAHKHFVFPQLICDALWNRKVNQSL